MKMKHHPKGFMNIKYLFLLYPIVLISTIMSLASAEDTKAGKCASVHLTPIAVFIQPSEKEIELMQKEDEEAFYTIADDAMYYQSQAIEYLEKMKFPYCFTLNEKHVFKAEDNKQYAVNNTCEAWCLILWNAKEKPVSTYTVDISMHESYLKRAGLGK